MLLLLAAAPGRVSACPIGGEAIHWLADYCMLTLETDDEIAASACIEAELARPFPDECARKRHYKAAMCDILVRAGTREGSAAQCAADPAFKGRTVEAGGVGG